MSFWKKSAEESSAIKEKRGTPATASRGTGAWSADSAAQSVVGAVEVSSDAEVVPPVDQKEAVVDQVQRRFGSVRSALGPGTNIQGKLSFDVAVRIDGELGGEVYSSQPLIIGPGGQVKASIEASSLIILGTVEGDVTARDRVEILNGGALRGSVKAPVFVIEEEAAFNGTVSMGGKAKLVRPHSDTPLVSRK